MKAYQVWDCKSCENWSTVVFAESVSEAKVKARSTDDCEGAEYINIRVKRLPEMDDHYRGRDEIDWWDAEDRRALVALGWECAEPDVTDCPTCPARDLCGYWEAFMDLIEGTT